MNEEQIELIQSSWAKVVPISDTAAELFYKKLFELEPTLKFLFKAPIEVQGKLLMKTLDAAVGGLNDLPALVPVLQSLGKRHAPYGVIDKDYDAVGAALIDTLGKGLGDDFTDEVKEAWVGLYGVVADTMKAAQAEVTLEGPLTPREKRMVQGSWAAVVPIADKAAEIFYAKLFELDPSLRPMFPSEMTDQGKKLMQMLGVAVKGLDKLEEIVPAVQALGKRHAGYGVKDEHYDTVAEAFLYTLGQGLGDLYTDEIEAAWVKVYTLLADTMKAAAADAPAESGESPTPKMQDDSPNVKAGVVMMALCLGVVVAGTLQSM